MKIWAKFALVTAAALIAHVCLKWREKHEARLPLDVAADHRLSEHSKMFNPAQIVKVTEGVHVAIGYALGNMILIEGTDGVLIVDTTESQEVSVAVFKEYQKITTKPLAGIVVTHFHADHIMGAKSLIDQADGPVKVFMHSTTESELLRYALTKDENFRRATRQFGSMLIRGREHVNSGIGPRLAVGEKLRYQPVKATHTFDTRKSYTVAGIEFELIHTPGETDDQVTVWLPKHSVVLPADNIYRSFPNLYAIRGNPPRSCLRWCASLDQVRELNARYLIPSHTRHLVGADEVRNVITHYRDAIQFVHDQTIRHVNKGTAIDEIVEIVRLPPSLARHPFLQEFYGSVAWSVRGVYDSLFGWFDGDPVNLNPLTKRKRAARLEALLSPDFETGAPPADKAMKNARDAIERSNKHFEAKGVVLREELQWALELSSLAIDWGGGSQADELTKVKHDALTALARASGNSNARNYYLTSAKELDPSFRPVWDKDSQRKAMMFVDLDTLMQYAPIRLMAEACDDTVLITLLFNFTDQPKWHRYVLRHCVLEHSSGLKDEAKPGVPTRYDVRMTLESSLWREIVAQIKSPMMAYAAGSLQVDGSLLQLRQVFDLIDRQL